MQNVMPLPVVQEAPAPPLQPEATRPEPNFSVDALARSAMRKHFEIIVGLESALRNEGLPEAVHDTRVAIRRLRATIGLFKAALPQRAMKIRDELRWLSRALGKVRDIDVQREEVARWIEDAAEEERAGLQAIDGVLAERRAKAHATLLRTLESQRYTHLKESVEGFLRRSASPRSQAANLPAVVVMPDLIAKRYRRVRKAGRKLKPSSPAADLHRLRIRCKRLRYALEVVGPLYPEPSKTLIKRVTRLQDVLGRIQDAEVAIEHLQELGRTTGRRLPAGATFAMGRIAERHHERAADLRRRFPSALAALEGKRWKQLKREMERRRRAGAVPMMG